MRFTLTLAVLGILSIGCNAKKTGTGAGSVADEKEYTRLDLAKVSQDLKDNRTAAFKQYMGKNVEFDVNEIDVKERNRLGVSLVFSDPTFKSPGSEHMGYLGHFALGDDRNESLRTLMAGTYRGKVRGTVAGFAAGATPGYENIELRPVWLVGELKPVPAGS